MHRTELQRSTNTFAFTRLELLACVLGCGLIMAVILPGLANSTTRSDRVACLNNLRQIGTAYANWGLEAELGLPPWRVSSASGGNSDHPLKSNLYLQFSVLSNWLGHPKLLADPGDQRRSLNPARHWGPSTGGLWNPSHLNNAVSYFLGPDGTFRMPRAVLSGDRNLSNDGFEHSSGSGMTYTRLNPLTVQWTNDVHGSSGNLLFYDGSVEQMDTRRLREALQNDAGAPVTNGVLQHVHALMTFY